jgi:hypothetical protein
MTRLAVGRAALAVLSLALALAGPGVAWEPAGAATVQLRNDDRSALDNQGRRSKMAADWASGPCDGVTRVDGLVGRTDAQIVETLGEPERRETFRLGERPDEFHISLQNFYPLSEPANAKVQVQELTWTKGKCRLTVWLHNKGGNWVGLDSIRYSTEAEF